MIKLLLIGPSTKEAITDTRWVTAPLGVHRIASYLREHNIYCEVWDQNIDNDSINQRICNKDWDIIGFSTLEATEEYDMSLIHLAKRLRSDSILVAGGTGATLNYQEYFNKTPLDIVIQAEGEFALAELCKMIMEKGFNNAPLHTIDGIIIRRKSKIFTQEDYWNISKCLDVKAMKASAYWNKTSLLYGYPDINEINTFRLFTSNFCPMGCAFCTLSRLRKYSCGGHTPVVALTANQIIYLIHKVLDEYPTCKQIFLVDDDFFILKKRGIEFCQNIIDLKQTGKIPQDLRLICLTNINRIDKDNIDVIAQAGFRVLSIGAESVSQHVLNSMDKKQTVEKIWSTTKLILSRGIKPYYTLILFAPDSTIEDLIIDLEGFRKLGAMGVGLSIEPVFIPLKGTRFSEEHYPERVRRVSIEGTNEYLFKGFAWLPRNKDVSVVFEEFEKIYPKYRQHCFQTSIVKHKEKNWQAYVILDTLEYVLIKLGLYYNVQNNVMKVINQLENMPEVTVDTIGAITK